MVILSIASFDRNGTWSWVPGKGCRLGSLVGMTLVDDTDGGTTYVVVLDAWY